MRFLFVASRFPSRFFQRQPHSRAALAVSWPCGSVGLVATNSPEDFHLLFIPMLGTHKAPRSKLWGITELNFEDFSETEANPVASYGESSS